MAFKIILASLFTLALVSAHKPRGIDEEICSGDNPMKPYADARPDPRDCSKYYVCDWGKAIHMSCPEGLYFSGGICTFQHLANCETVDEMESYAAAPTFERHSRRRVSCPSTPSSHAILLPDPEDCTAYYVCEWDKPIKMYCAPDLHFNPSLKVCDYPEKAGCEQY